MASTLALSLVCLALFSVMVGIASLGLALFVVLRDRLFPINATMLRSEAIQFEKQSEDIQSISAAQFSGINKTPRKNEQLYAANDDNVIDLDDAGLIRMNRLRVPRGVQSKIDETTFITENADDNEHSSVDEMTLKSSQHPSDVENEKTVDGVETLEKSSHDNDKLSEDPTTDSEMLKDSDSEKMSESSGNKLTSEKQVVPSNVDPNEDLELKEVDKQYPATSMTTVKTSTTVITEVTFTIEPPFEKIIVEPLCSTDEMSTC